MPITKEQLYRQLVGQYIDKKPNATSNDVHSYADNVIGALVTLGAFISTGAVQEPGGLPEVPQDSLGPKAEQQFRTYSYNDQKLSETVRKQLTQEEWTDIAKAIAFLARRREFN